MQDLNPYYLIILIPPFVSWLVLLVGYMYVAKRPFYYTNTEILVEGVKFIILFRGGNWYIYGLIPVLIIISFISLNSLDISWLSLFLFTSILWIY